MRRIVPVFLVLGLAGAAAAPSRSTVLADIPTRLSDQEFWRFITDVSEPGGTFRSANITNLTSNELWYQHVIPDLVRRTTGGGPAGVYLGVGPEQNYTYIAAIKPKMVIIFDVRRGNLDLQLMYKAVFELSKDRADFVSMLFAKPRPANLKAGSTAAELFAAFAASPTGEALYKEHLAAIKLHLTKTHAFPVPADDLAGIDAVYEAFYWNGFALRSSPTYADLMTATNEAGVAQSYLASEEHYRVLRDLNMKNLMIPVVGDFGGPKAIRAVGAWLKSQGATVSAFYLSNVEQYLVQDGKWDAFCRNVATLPLDAASTFIRSSSRGGGSFGRGGGFVSSLGKMVDDTATCR